MSRFFMELKGGLGNQLFQLAFSLARAAQNSSQFVLLMPKSSRVFSLGFLGLELNRYYRAEIVDGEFEIWKSSNLPIYPLNAKRIEEPHFGFSDFTTEGSKELFSGYFQSFKYFENIGDELRKYIRLKLDLLPWEDSEIPTIHVRLGDYVSNPNTRSVHGVISMDYIMRGVTLLGSELKEFRVVTDDIGSLERLFPRIIEEIGLNHIHSGNQLKDFKTLASSKSLIISNSTFSWWAAYLSQGCVVAPSKWFEAPLEGFRSQDFFPTEWSLT